MNILFTRFPLESHFGGAEVQTLSLMKGLVDRDHQVGFLGSCPTLREQLAVSNWQLAYLDIGPPPVTKWSSVSFVWRKNKMRAQLIKALQKLTANSQLPTAIFMLSLSEKLLLTDWCTQNGIKVFWIEHDRVGRWLQKNPWLPRLKQLSKLATTVVVSDLSKEIYEELGWEPERVVSIPNGIDLTKCEMRNANIETKRHGTFRIGCIARLTHDKGVDVLIEAAKDLPNVSLMIVGTGREEGKIKKYLRQNLTPNTYHLTPSHPNITSFYSDLNCFVLPSRDHDPFGLVAAEAMASGVPTIVTDACGISRHLKEGEAIVVPAGNAKALRKALQKVQKDDVWKQLSENGRSAARERFSVERMVDEYEKLIS